MGADIIYEGFGFATDSTFNNDCPLKMHSHRLLCDREVDVDVGSWKSLCNPGHPVAKAKFDGKSLATFL